MRSSRDHLWQIGLFSNPVLMAMIAGVLVLQLGVIYIPFLQTYFHTQPLSWPMLLLIFGANAMILLISEMVKGLGKAV